MYGEERQVLEKILAAVEDNNRMLRRSQRARRWGNFFSFLKWAFIVASALGLYYYLQPYLEVWPILGDKLPELLKNLDLLNQAPR
ncbi:MAG: hypothetical protein AAB505_01180 [Patescibacteria group bacterium]